ncbi:Slp family lipoprotein [Edwardsiella ictaluri]|uniref:Outer membrane lipoprotein, Slp family n=1 Tax=Edwardsiella ictaluri (strain 93-146) TaxID=634503 RepID=C5BA27_EDWI9|nr:Slp family lipoprotein [Edwardsiella ictaluri]ACR69148.1 outer membrane lipoprotein, Slp family [Edwardsiella ictaluri 93-146]EKS7764504.1 Slp family lipoprotein [Edwardsiella ictaluri]EKS7771424.1 Slp family lipoprotein [Edwardsiella ictaluri]EKS7774540.1 Slp family lipoprotein [Edwardsiella ictaluri]EKS7777824.1 Slp family lipoprotein [Edwardsiella ictaluri]
MKCRHSLFAAALCAPLMLSGCAAIPRDIQGNNSPILQKNFNQIHMAPNLYTGQQVRLGGRVINVINLPKQTLLEIAVLPLNSAARPQLNKPYQGRLIARSDRFLDPVNYRNHLLTVLGTLSGSEMGKIGSAPYTFVRLNIQGIQLWQVSETQPPVAAWDYGIGPNWPLSWQNQHNSDLGWGWYPILQPETASVH